MNTSVGIPDTFSSSIPLRNFLVMWPLWIQLILLPVARFLHYSLEDSACKCLPLITYCPILSSRFVSLFKHHNFLTWSRVRGATRNRSYGLASICRAVALNWLGPSPVFLPWSNTLWPKGIIPLFSLLLCLGFLPFMLPTHFCADHLYLAYLCPTLTCAVSWSPDFSPVGMFLIHCLRKSRSTLTSSLLSAKIAKRHLLLLISVPLS